MSANRDQPEPDEQPTEPSGARRVQVPEDPTELRRPGFPPPPPPQPEEARPDDEEAREHERWKKATGR
jgi:hypothetical protein